MEKKQDKARKATYSKPIDCDPRQKLKKYIDDGALICLKLKHIYFDNIPWKDCYRKVSEIYTVIKKRTRPSYDCLTDNEFIEALKDYSEEDLRIVYGTEFIPGPSHSEEESTLGSYKAIGEYL